MLFGWQNSSLSSWPCTQGRSQSSTPIISCINSISSPVVALDICIWHISGQWNVWEKLLEALEKSFSLLKRTISQRHALFIFWRHSGWAVELLRLGLDVVISWLWTDESETKANSLKEMEQKEKKNLDPWCHWWAAEINLNICELTFISPFTKLPVMGSGKNSWTNGYKGYLEAHRNLNEINSPCLLY